MRSAAASPGGPLRPDLLQKLRRIRLLVTDVDGVLTDGTLYYGASGEVTKAFNVRDGMGLRRLMDSGIGVAVISGRACEALTARMKDLRIDHVYDGCSDKWGALQTLLEQLSIAPEEVAFVGDDVNDLDVLRRVGLAIAVRDAEPAVRGEADWVTTTGGGNGAVREIAEAIMRSQHEQAEAFRVVIPSRYNASRLPGKPLRRLAGRTMIAHVYDRGVDSGASEVLVATDDERIRAEVEGFGGRALMTSPDHASGSDRLAEVVDQLGWSDDSIVVNLQGDEPCMDSALLRRAALALSERPNAGIATFATPIRNATDVFDPNVVKVVLDDDGMASYFSRAPIPWVRDTFPTQQLPPGVSFLRHLGLYAYRGGVLRRLAAEAQRPAERAESLEQLRALALGIGIHVSVIDQAPGHGVDTEDDLARAQRELEGA
jgi:3-deoxy-manno-octulosonate cytidylyltransferase (CMP-KDO synthetase)